MQELSAWSLLPPLLTIGLAILTRQVIPSLLLGAVVGFIILADFQFFTGLSNSVQGVVDVFKSDGAVRTILFGIMVGGIIHLARYTGGMQRLVQLLTDRARVAQGPVSTQLLGAAVTSCIFIESNLSLLTSGAVTGGPASQHRVSREQMAYVIQNTGLSVWSSVLINGWGAAMMGVIAVQVQLGLLQGEPFSILARAIVFNLFAWVSLIFVMLSVFNRLSFPAMRQANSRAAQGIELREGALPLMNDEPTATPGNGRVLNLLLPLLTMLCCVPLGLYVTGNGQISKGSGSTAVLWAVLAGQLAAFILYVLWQRRLSVNEFFRQLLIGYQSMMPLAVIMTLAFLIGNVASQLNIGAYLAALTADILPAAMTAGFVFVLAGAISLATGSSWGTFSIMIPIGIQLAVTAGADPYLAIGAAISGAILGDTISPISDTGIVTSMATRNDHMDHIRTQLPYCLSAAAVALLGFVLLGYYQAA